MVKSLVKSSGLISLLHNLFFSYRGWYALKINKNSKLSVQVLRLTVFFFCEGRKVDFSCHQHLFMLFLTNLYQFLLEFFTWAFTWNTVYVSVFVTIIFIFIENYTLSLYLISCHISTTTFFSSSTSLVWFPSIHFIWKGIKNKQEMYTR